MILKTAHLALAIQVFPRGHGCPSLCYFGRVQLRAPSGGPNHGLHACVRQCSGATARCPAATTATPVYVRRVESFDLLLGGGATQHGMLSVQGAMSSAELPAIIQGQTSINNRHRWDKSALACCSFVGPRHYRLNSDKSHTQEAKNE